MPYINIRIGCALNDLQRSRLYEQTTALMGTLMGKRRDVTVVHVQESDARSWSTNGLALTPRDAVGAYVVVKVTAGTNTAQQKADMIAAMVELLVELVGAVQEACYVVIDEIPADSWGYNGRTQAARAAAKG